MTSVPPVPPLDLVPLPADREPSPAELAAQLRVVISGQQALRAILLDMHRDLTAKIDGVAEEVRRAYGAADDARRVALAVEEQTSMLLDRAGVPRDTVPTRPDLPVDVEET